MTDTNGAHAQGSMISFRLAKDRVRFEVSVDAADKSGLKLSARMLSIALPGMPGVDLAQAAIRSHQNLKVVFSSGYGAVSKHQFAHPFSTLSKPFTLKKLQRTLEEVAGVQSA